VSHGTKNQRERKDKFKWITSHRLVGAFGFKTKLGLKLTNWMKFFFCLFFIIHAFEKKQRTNWAIFYHCIYGAWKNSKLVIV